MDAWYGSYDLPADSYNSQSIDDPTPELLDVMDRLEESMHWRPCTDRALPERIYHLAEGALSLKERAPIDRESRPLRPGLGVGQLDRHEPFLAILLDQQHHGRSILLRCLLHSRSDFIRRMDRGLIDHLDHTPGPDARF